jgi:hypothetical protein
MTSITNITDALINIIRRTILVTCQPTIPVGYIAYQISQIRLVPNEAESVHCGNVVSVGEKLNTYRSLVGKPEEKRSFGSYWARGMVIL